MLNTIISFTAGVVAGILGNYFYAHLLLRFRRHKRDYLPMILNDAANWIHSDDADGNTYSYGKDPEYKIKIGEGQDVLAEKYKKFPDTEHDRICWIEVRFGDAKLFGWNFMYLDGYRYLVPVPKIEKDPSGQYYDFYDLNSMEVNVFKIIGEANLMGEKSKIEGLKSIARILGIAVTEL